jgi:hypothetical protein
MSVETRLRVGSFLLAFAALGLASASFAIVSPTPGLAEKIGRHLLAGSLANLAVSLLLFLIAAIPLRRGQRWALWAYCVPFIVYGVPVLVVDATHVARERLFITLLPQILGLLIAMIGLLIVGPAVAARSAPRS